MIMDNIIFLVIDAFCYDNLERMIGNKHTTPFLRRLRDENVSFDHMYSQAPYTEAALVSILSGENILENGGYLYGNQTVQSTIFERYKERGYKTISQYSPYIYSKAYLRGVDEYYYTRLINIKVLFDYRLDHYYIKYIKGGLSKNEMQVCIFLLREGFETWIGQAIALINKEDTCRLIQDWVDLDDVRDVFIRLQTERAMFDKDPRSYLEMIFANFSDNRLLKLNKRYNKRKKLYTREVLIEKYQARMDDAQKKYDKIIRKTPIDIGYLYRTWAKGKGGARDFIGLVHNYIRYYKNDHLSGYLTRIDENAKTEVCMRKQFKYVLDRIDEANREGRPAIAYLHVQDFHLPTVFHSVEEGDFRYVSDEIEDVLDFFDGIDDSYKGNILADLGAYHCDRKIEGFFKESQKRYGEDFKLVVTADHGYPSYFDPPRPVIYNQTYVEAFHVPYIMYNDRKKYRSAGIYSSMDFFALLDDRGRGVEERRYILSEYGGPGCPDISDKPVWYTYINKKYRVSAECLLEDEVTYEKLKAVFEIVKDRDEKNNLINDRMNDKEILDIVADINTRHLMLRERFLGKRFLEYINSKVSC